VSKPHIHGFRSPFCVSDALDILGDDISAIRQSDRLTWDDVGRELGKGKDRAQDYAKGISEMPVSAFLLGCRAWNGRFSDRVLAMIGMKLAPLETTEPVTQHTASCITKLLLELSVALEDGKVDDRELAGMRTALDEAGRAVDAMRAKLGVRSVA
jgi:hypothetical protein